MTNEEAIRQYQKFKKLVHGTRAEKKYGEMFSILEEALEKQIPKKLVNHDNCGNCGLYYERCPICFEIIIDNNYCHNCGQKIE